MSNKTEVQNQLKEIQEGFDSFERLFNDLSGSSTRLSSIVNLQLDEKVKDLIYRLKAVLIKISDLRNEYIIEKDKLVEKTNLLIAKGESDCFKNLSKLLVCKIVVQVWILELHNAIYNFSLLCTNSLDNKGELTDKSIYATLLNQIKLIERKLQEFEVALSKALNS